jgi:DNA polymerase-3 subunit alpha
VKDGDEMLEVFRDHPSAVANTLEIAERCDLDLGIDNPEYHMPEFQVPAGLTREAVLERQAWLGLRERLGLDPDEPVPPKFAEYSKRMEHELGVITSMGFAGYFLIVSDFISYARKNGIPVGPGRGSAAGSLAAYGLGITGVDPIEYDIIFERFLNPERISMPDIDVDFCMKGRDQVIRYVADKYDGEGDEGKRWCPRPWGSPSRPRSSSLPSCAPAWRRTVRSGSSSRRDVGSRGSPVTHRPTPPGW